MFTLQSCTGPVQGQNRVFPVKFSTQGKTCFHYREPLFLLQGPLFSLQGFPCEKTSQGKPCFHYREWVCSVTSIHHYFDDTRVKGPCPVRFAEKGTKISVISCEHISCLVFSALELVACRDIHLECSKQFN